MHVSEIRVIQIRVIQGLGATPKLYPTHLCTAMWSPNLSAMPLFKNWICKKFCCAIQTGFNVKINNSKNKKKIENIDESGNSSNVINPVE